MESSTAEALSKPMTGRNYSIRPVVQVTADPYKSYLLEQSHQAQTFQLSSHRCKVRLAERLEQLLIASIGQKPTLQKLFRCVK